MILRASFLSWAANTCVLLWGVLTCCSAAFCQPQIIFSESFADPPNGNYTARGEGSNTAGTQYWTLGSNIFGGPATVSDANGWKVIGDTSPFLQISLVGDISYTTYIATEATQTLMGPAIIAIDAGGALRPNNTGGQTITPARRVHFAMEDSAVPADLTSDYLTMFDAMIDWASSGGTNLQIGWVNNSGSLIDRNDSWDLFATDRLTSQGHSIIELSHDDDPAVVAPNANMFIFSDDIQSGNVGTRYNNLGIPLVNGEQALNDELGIASGGAGRTFGSMEITTPAHPIAAGLTGIVEISNPPTNFHVPGNDVAPGGTVVATYETTTTGVPEINTLAEADQLKSGELPSDVSTGTIAQADIWDSGGMGRWSFDNFVTNFEEDDFAVFSTGTLNVTEQRVYHFAITGDDGGRLRIDQNGDGVLDASDDVIVDDSTHGVQDRFGSVELGVGMHDFEWVGFERGGGAGWEFSVALEPATAEDPYDGDDGDFFTGADMDAGFSGGADADNPRSITTRPINIAAANKNTLQVSVDLGATDPGPWEDVDFLRILVDPDASGPDLPVTLKQFVGAGGATGDALSDGTTDLGRTLQNFVLDIDPALVMNSSELQIIIEALSSAGNEQVAIENLALMGEIMGLVGDYNGDGTVNAADYVLFRNNLGQDASAFAPGSRDPSNSGPVNQADYDFWAANFGNTSGSSNAVPEPMSAWLLAIGLCLLHLKSRRTTR